jgi:hypothetical protein
LILSVEKYKNSTSTVLELKNKVVEKQDKISHRKSVLFPYTNPKFTKKEIRKIMQFTVATKYEMPSWMPMKEFKKHWGRKVNHVLNG